VHGSILIMYTSSLYSASSKYGALPPTTRAGAQFMTQYILYCKSKVRTRNPKVRSRREKYIFPDRFIHSVWLEAFLSEYMKNKW